MVTVMMLLTAKPDLGRDRFIDYYESQHLPLVLRLFPEIVGHTRNFVPPELYGTSLGFDALVEMTFVSEEGYRAAVTRREKNSDVAALLTHDEEQFIDRRKLFTFVVEQHRTTIVV
jgi:hypothetical protein